MKIGDVATWAGAAFSLITGVVAIILATQLRNRERRLALVDLHQSLTTGETAAARNVMGTLLYADAGSAPTKLDSIDAYFRLIWAVQRARNVFRTYKLCWKSLSGPVSRLDRIQLGRRQRESDLALTWNLNEVAQNLVIFHDLYQEAWNVSDGDAWADVEDFVDVEAVRQKLSDDHSLLLLGQG